MEHDASRDVFNATGGWSVVHHVRDDWDLSLIRAALTHAEIPHKVRDDKMEDGSRVHVIAVPVESEDEAMDVLMRVAAATDPSARSADDELAQDSPATHVRAIATDVSLRLVAEREDVGQIVHIEGHGYELRVGPEPYYIVPDDRWEEFTDFSAQRQEFAILLEKEFESLYRWLRAEKRFGDFLRLVESTYRGSPDDDSPEHFFRAAAWMLAILLAIAALVAVFRWLEGMTTAAPS
ncbi:hypothetical protein FJZ36_08355 [Candidatus Poribacteria bacterium]|nr:hypothetical protein [Candidatus Poribacteria bacterium]